MANIWYPTGLKHFARGEVVWKASGGSVVKASLIDVAQYTYSAAHEYMNTNTVAGASKVATLAAGMTLVDAAAAGVLDAADAVFPSVTGVHVEAVIVWLDGGDGGTTAAGTVSFLLAYIDTVSSGLPVTPNGGDITVQWLNGATPQIATL
jgi:hypothetical protein